MHCCTFISRKPPLFGLSYGGLFSLRWGGVSEAVGVIWLDAQSVRYIRLGTQ